MNNILINIIKKYEDYNCKSVEKTTYLDVLGRTYDEDLISRVLAYILRKNIKLVVTLINQYKRDGNPIDLKEQYRSFVVCEKYMGNGRADVFIELLDGKNVIATITIENKIYSSEHGNQTDKYFKWVNKHNKYIEACNTFFYLRPSFNCSVAGSDNYINLTYMDIVAMVENDETMKNDVIINDFIEHVRKYLGDNTMAFLDYEKEAYVHYKELSRILDETKKKICKIQENVFGKVEEELGKNGYNVMDYMRSEETDNGQYVMYRQKVNSSCGVESYRLYKLQWYKENEFYFYVEIKFEEGRFDEIHCQPILKKYNKESDIDQFVKELVDKVDNKVAEIEKNYCIMDKNVETFFSEKILGSAEWIDELSIYAVDKLLECIFFVDKIYNEYIDGNQEENENAYKKI